MSTTDSKSTKKQAKITQIDEDVINKKLDTMVKSTVEEMINGMLDPEADVLCNADRYERNPERSDYRSGHYNRKLHTTAGEVNVKVPNDRIAEVAGMLKAIHAQENRTEARKKAKSVIENLKKMKLSAAAKVVDEGIEETFSYYKFPHQYWRRLRTNNRL